MRIIYISIIFSFTVFTSLFAQTTKDSLPPSKVNYTAVFDSLLLNKKHDSLTIKADVSKNVFLFGVSKLLRGYASFYYERQLFRSFDICAGAGINLSNDYVVNVLYPEMIASDGNPGEQILSLLFHAQQKKGGLMLDLCAKYYPNKFKNNNGFYLGPMFTYYKYNVLAKSLPQGDFYVQDMAIRNGAVTVIYDHDQQTLIRSSYFLQNQKFEINNTHYGLVLGYKKHSKGKIKVHYDWSFSFVRNIITTNQIAISNSIPQGQNYNIAYKISQPYSIKRLWFGVNLKIGFGK
jgi:hypothetical protein